MLPVMKFLRTNIRASRMGKKDPRVDAYIARSADFAKPILRHIRNLVHAGCPDVDETIKWGFPHFEYKGVLCSMASFKAHCAFGFWKGSLLFDTKAPGGNGEEAMGQFGRITSLSDLPGEKAFIGYVKKAAKLNDEGVRLPARTRSRERKPLVIPSYFKAALGKNRNALAAFEDFSYSHRKEYVEWVSEAKTEETRQRRMQTAIEWMAEGKERNWKYAGK